MSLNNETLSVNKTSVSTIIVVLDLVQQRFINQLPLIMTLFGFIGFIGNTFTFLQPTLRNNSFYIYTLLGSFIDIINLFVNLFPNYLNPEAGNLISTISASLLCKFKLFVLVFLPQLFMNLLIMSLIDRYACTFGPTSRMSRFLQLKIVPWLITMTVIISCLISLYAPILNGILPGFGCGLTSPTTNVVLYIMIHGIITPALMLIIVLLTYRQFRQNRQRVGAVVEGNRIRIRNHFIAMVSAQVFVTSFFAVQWIAVYWFFLETQNDHKSAEGWAITYFVLNVANNLYFIINVRSFYLSTLTSRLFRDTLITAVLKLFPGHLDRRWNAQNERVTITAGIRWKREERPPREI